MGICYFQVQKNRAAILCMIKTIIMCGQQNIAMRGTEENQNLSENLDKNLNIGNEGNFRSILRLMVMCGDETLKKHFETAPKNARYTAPKIQNEIINIIGELIQKKLLVILMKVADFTLFWQMKRKI